MFDPETTSEQLLLVTVRLEAIIQEEGEEEAREPATAFVFKFEPPGREPVLALVTNKHVRIGATAIDVWFHLARPTTGGKGEIVGDTYPVTIDPVAGWIDHPDPDVDLCAYPCADLVAKISAESGLVAIQHALDRSLIQSDEQLQAFSLAEDVLMVGYPSGIWDEAHNLPLLRRGMTATHASLDFNGRPEGVLDIAAIGGSSGSPVAFVSEGATFNRKPQAGGVFMEPGGRFVLLGIAAHQATLNARGTIERRPIQLRRKPEQAWTPVPVHLAYYVKAKALLDLEALM